MKKVFIARHAKAEFKDNIEDYQRSLTSRGLADCNVVAKAIIAFELPELIICSSAKRTLETAQNIVSAIDKQISIEISEILYRASKTDIIQLISALSEKYSNIMIIGHNPSIHEVLLELANNANISKEDAIRMGIGMIPAAIALFEFDQCDSWKNLQQKRSVMKWFFYPH